MSETNEILQTILHLYRQVVLPEYSISYILANPRLKSLEGRTGTERSLFRSNVFCGRAHFHFPPVTARISIETEEGYGAIRVQSVTTERGRGLSIRQGAFEAFQFYRSIEPRIGSVHTAGVNSNCRFGLSLLLLLLVANAITKLGPGYGISYFRIVGFSFREGHSSNSLKRTGLIVTLRTISQFAITFSRKFQ